MAQAVVIDKCDLCDSEDQVEYFCINCQEILCLTCKLSHSKSKKTRKDKIISLSQARHDDLVHKTTTVYCREHATEEITLFCLKCHQLICMQCVAGKHGGHNVISPDEIRDSKAEELRKNIKALKEQKTVYENAFQTEGRIHSQVTKSIDQVRNEISDQKAKIIEELNLVCDEQFAELTKFQQKEDKRYSEACNEIQGHNQTVTSSLQGAEESLGSSNTALIIQATVDTTNTLQRLQQPTKPPTMTANYTPGDRSRPAVRHMQGKVNITQTTTYQAGDDSSHPIIPQPQEKLQPEQGAKPKLMTDVHKHQQQKQSEDKQQQRQDVIKPRDVRVKSTIRVKNISGTIGVIVPLKNKTAWVKSDWNKLSLIDRGKVITTSASLDGNIVDAKEYREELLVICYNRNTIIKLSADGQSVSTFSDLSPYHTWGLCVTQEMDVVVCLRSSKDEKDNKVVRLNSSGQITQTIQHGTTGAPLYCYPYRVTSLTTGDIIVLDSSQSRRITGVDREGQHLFTWEEEIQGMKLSDKHIQHITHDSNGNLFVTDFINDRVCVLGKDGSGARCLLDSTQGIERPIGMAVDSAGQLWVGCKDGKVHIIEYRLQQ